MKRTYKQLLRIFKRLRAPNPEDWAASEVEEDLPQLASFLFMKEAWAKGVLKDGSVAWIDTALKNPPEDPAAPLAGLKPALNRLLEKGIDAKDLTEVVRIMQYETLFQLCYLLSDPALEDSDVKDIAWELYELDKAGNPVRSMGGLHEYALGMDPTGREMRPRKAE